MLAASVYTAAIVLATAAQQATAIDYAGGWLPAPPKEQCVDICSTTTADSSAFCLKNPATNATDANCTSRKQRAGDFDYMAFEQLYMPQFCRDLLRGVDSTVSHQNVNAYPNGVTCKPEAVENELTIHGLWPNYNNGYPGCCYVSDTIANKPYNAADFAKNQPDLLDEMADKWVDPTQSNEYDTLCEIYNHEFQKHGICYNGFGDDYEKAAVNYFKATLKVGKQLKKATKQINKWAKKSVAPTVRSIQALYSKSVMVLCSNVPGESGNKLSVIRTCWEKPAVLTDEGPFNQIDCGPPSTTGTFIPCNSTLGVKLDPYVAEAYAF